MVVKMFNFWYFFFLLVSVGACVGLFFLLRNKSQKTKKIVLFSLLALGLLLHFLKAFIPPYSTNQNILWRDIWFINICGANIFLFPFIFLSKNEKLKDYMFYIGVLSGVLAILYPVEPIQKANPSAEWLDVLRFYYHHAMLCIVPLLMVLLKLHKLNYKRVLFVPLYFTFVMMFIIINQILQSELGFVAQRSEDFININYKNTSFIWGPGNDSLATVFSILCPKVFKTVPVGDYAGETKYWPLIWLLIPMFIYVVPLSFGISMIFDHKNFVLDVKNLKNKLFRPKHQALVTLTGQTELVENFAEQNKPDVKTKK